MNAPFWYAVQTQANREARAAFELEKQGFEVFFPRCMKQISHARRISSITAPLFPGYLFVRMGAAARWRAINGTVGVIRLVMAGAYPARLAEGIIEGLLARRDERGYVPLPPRATLTPGETIRIGDGAFADAFGLFEEARDLDRVSILLDLLGRKVRVLLDGAQVEKAA